MRSEFSIDALVADLRPVRGRSLWRDVAVFAGVAMIELVLWVLLGFVRPDFAEAMQHPTLPWKLGSLFVLALLGAATALSSLAPERSPRQGLAGVAAAIGLALLIGGVIGVAPASLADVAARMDWRHGLMCVEKMTALSLPPAVVLALLARRAAPTHLGGTAMACGLAAAGWGAFVFAFACPSDDPLYIAVWYLIGCGLTALVARVVITWAARW